MTQTQSTKFTRLSKIAAVAVVFLATSCGGTSTPTNAISTLPVATSTNSTGASPASSPQTTARGASAASSNTASSGRVALPPPVALDKTVWWSPDRDQHGLVKIHFTEAQLDPTGSLQTITLSYTAQNVQPATRYLSFGSETVLKVGGEPTTQPQGKQIQITAGDPTDGKVSFQVDVGATIDNAELVLGEPDTNQTVVPLAPAKAVTTTEPRTGFAVGTVHGLDHSIAINSSILYADTTLGEKAKSVIALTVKATYNGPGGGLIGTSNFMLTMPDGSVTPGVQIVGEPLEPLNAALNIGETSPSQLLGFEVDQPSVGAYTLTYTSSAATDTDKPTAYNFTIAP
jgi:hypothetical protein